MKSILLIIPMMFFSCTEKKEDNYNENENIITTSQQKEPEDKNDLLIRAINKGDTVSYKKLSNFYLSTERAQDFFIYSYIMAYEHNYPKAYFDLYDSLMFASVQIDQFERDKSKKMAIYYLLKAYELDYAGAKIHIKKYFTDESIPKSKDYFLQITE